MGPAVEEGPSSVATVVPVSVERSSDSGHMVSGSQQQCDACSMEELSRISSRLALAATHTTYYQLSHAHKSILYVFPYICYGLQCKAVHWSLSSEAAVYEWGPVGPAE